MTSEGHPYAAFQRAIERRNVVSAWMTAFSLHQISLADSLALMLLVLDRDPGRFPRVALRWHARYCRECSVSLERALAVLALLTGMQASDPRGAGSGLRSIFDGDGDRELANEVRRWEAFASQER